MTEVAEFFRSSKEAENARPKLTRDCMIPLAEFGGLVGKTEFHPDDAVLCQLVKERGYVCKHKHWNGWIAKHKNGSEGYIGGDCAKRHFNDDPNFKAAFVRDSRRIESAIKRADLMRRISVRISDAGFANRLKDYLSESRALKDQIVDVLSLLPTSVKIRLSRLQKQIMPAVEIAYRYVEIQEDGEEKSIWQPTTLASIKGIGGLNADRLLPANKAVHFAKAAFSNAQSTTDTSIRKLREYVEALEAVDNVQGIIDSVRKDLDAFMQLDNLRVLCWLVPSHDDQRAVIHQVLTWIEKKRPTSSAVAAIRTRWESEIRAANEGRDFKPI